MNGRVCLEGNSFDVEDLSHLGGQLCCVFLGKVFKAREFRNECCRREENHWSHLPKTCRGLHMGRVDLSE